MPEEKKEKSVLTWFGQLKPIVAEKPSGEIVVHMTVGDGQMLFTFSDIEQARSKELEVLLAVEWDGPDTYPAPFEARLNMLSLSSQDTFARRLSKTFGKGLPWDLALSRASAALRDFLATKDHSVALGDIEPRTEVSYLYEPFLLEGAPNILFGKGGSAKTALALRIGISIVTGLPFLGIPPRRKANVLFVDYEDTKEEFARRILLLLGAPDTAQADFDQVKNGIHYFPAKGTPITECIPAIRRVVEKNGIGLVIVDSAALAAGAEAERMETATRYFNALAKLGNVTTLTIAHETKNENNQTAFGSIFWTNCARNIWNAAITRDEFVPYENKRLHLGLYHRKCNSDRLRAPIPCLIAYDPGAIVMKLDNPKFVERELDTKTRIYQRLLTGPKSVQELSEDMEVKSKTVSNVLNEGRGLGMWENPERGVWELPKAC